MFLGDARMHFYAWHVLPASGPPFCKCLPGQEKTQIVQIPPAVLPAPHSASDTVTMKTWICSHQSLQRCLGSWIELQLQGVIRADSSNKLESF